MFLELWWAWEDSNFRPLDYQSNALTKTELQALLTKEHSTFELMIRQLLFRIYELCVGYRRGNTEES